MTQQARTAQDNVEIARQGFETYNRHGVRATAEEHWHPEVEWHVGPWAVVLGGQAEFRGREAGIAAIRELEAFLGRFTVDQHFWYAIEMDEGWERRIQVCGDPVEALEAVGLQA